MAELGKAQANGDRRIDDLADAQLRTEGRVAGLAEQMAELGRRTDEARVRADEARARADEAHKHADEQFRQTGERIDRMISAIGEFLRRGRRFEPPPPDPPAM